MDFFDALDARATAVNSLLCVGLDPHANRPEGASPEAAKQFCLNIIEQTSEFVLAYKPNIAFFEAFGPAGIVALSEIIAAVPDEIPLILDAKRGDIGSTTAAYATAAFDTLGADAITANPYLGADALEPLLNRADKGVFVLCKTSNPGSNDLQTKLIDGEPLYVHVARMTQTWSEFNNLGLVVGATWPDALVATRKAAPNAWFLAPGIGAQGGTVEATLSAGLRSDGLGMLVTVSRSVTQVDDPATAARELRDDINAHRT